VNLFLNELTGRADWQNMMMRFQVSDIDSLGLFVNLDYLRGAPPELGVGLRDWGGHGHSRRVSGTADAQAYQAHHRDCLKGHVTFPGFNGGVQPRDRLCVKSCSA